MEAAAAAWHPYTHPSACTTSRKSSSSSCCRSIILSQMHTCGSSMKADAAAWHSSRTSLIISSNSE